MRDADKPFIAYRQGRWGLKIVPRGAAGWWAFILWMLSLVPVAVLFIVGISREPEGAALIALIGGYVAALVIWGVVMVRWMLARSEVVQIEDLLALKREKEARDRERRR
jgi:hypothetical protein